MSEIAANADKLKKIFEKVIIVDEIEKNFEDDDEKENYDYLKNKKMLRWLKMSEKQLEKKIISKIANSETTDELQIIDGNDEIEKWIRDFERKNEFILLRESIAKNLSKFGKEIFLGYRKIENDFFAFTGAITIWEIDPISKKITNLEYIIDNFKIDGIEFDLTENWIYNFETKNYTFSRFAIDKQNTKKIKNEKLAKNLQISKNEIIQKEIAGIVMLNNLDRTSDIENIKEIAHLRGRFLYEIFRNVQKLSPKAFVRTRISEKSQSAWEKQMEELSIIPMSSKGEQFQNSATIFDPAINYEKYTKTIDWTENKALWIADCAPQVGSEKKAQQNNGENAARQDDNLTYLEKKQILRGIQFTNFFHKMALVQNFETNFSIQLSLPQVAAQLLDKKNENENENENDLEEIGEVDDDI